VLWFEAKRAWLSLEAMSRSAAVVADNLVGEEPSGQEGVMQCALNRRRVLAVDLIAAIRKHWPRVKIEKQDATLKERQP